MSPLLEYVQNSKKMMDTDIWINTSTISERCNTVYNHSILYLYTHSSNKLDP